MALEQAGCRTCGRVCNSCPEFFEDYEIYDEGFYKNELGDCIKTGREWQQDLDDGKITLDDFRELTEVEGEVRSPTFNSLQDLRRWVSGLIENYDTEFYQLEFSELVDAVADDLREDWRKWSSWKWGEQMPPNGLDHFDAIVAAYEKDDNPTYWKRDDIMDWIRREDTDETFGTLSTDDLHEIIMACCLYDGELEDKIHDVIVNHYN